VRPLIWFLAFTALTREVPETFEGQWSTVMAYARPLFESKLPGLGVGAWDLLLFAVVAYLAIQPRSWTRRIVALDLTLLGSLVAIAAWFAFGVLRGGDARQGQIQVNALVRLFALYFAIHAAHRSSRQATQLALVVLAAGVYRAVACLAFLFLVARPARLSPWPEAMTDHHDSALWASALVGLASWALVSRRLRTIVACAATGTLLILAVHYNDRRMAWLELAGGLGLVVLALTRGRRSPRLLRYGAMILPLVVLYAAVGWHSSERVFAPVQQFRSLMDAGDPSNDAREIENRGLVVTLQENRFLGTGFGHPFTEVSVVYSLGMARSFPNYRYLPHNSLVGLVAFTGIVGFSIIWTFVPACGFLATAALSRAGNRRERALCLTAFAVPFVYSVQAFGDMGAQSLQAGVVAASALAIAARLAATTGAWPATRRTDGPSQGSGSGMPNSGLSR
jgi:hypothetical protein